MIINKTLFTKIDSCHCVLFVLRLRSFSLSCITHTHIGSRTCTNIHTRSYFYRRDARRFAVRKAAPFFPAPPQHFCSILPQKVSAQFRPDRPMDRNSCWNRTQSPWCGRASSCITPPARQIAARSSCVSRPWASREWTWSNWTCTKSTSTRSPGSSRWVLIIILTFARPRQWNIWFPPFFRGRGRVDFPPRSKILNFAPKLVCLDDA